MSQKPLSQLFEPQLIRLPLQVSATTLQSVKDELSNHAVQDPDKCYGYFPGMKSNSTIDTDLPASKLFAQQVGGLEAGGRLLRFNFLRLSLINQPSVSPFHLDSDSSTALTGDVATIDERLVWRLLLNLSDHQSRTVTYLDIDPASVELEKGNGYIAYPSHLVDDTLVRSVVIPARDKAMVSGVLFCASRVLHAGKDVDGGHFVAGFGIDEEL